MTLEAPIEVVLVGSYPPDREESMLRYAALLGKHLPALGFRVTLLAPRARFNRFGRTQTGLPKFLGHLDKLILFPRELQRHLDWSDNSDGGQIVHICDNSNAFYATRRRNQLRRPLHLVTCHDFFALNGALGFEPGMRPRLTGRPLQRWTLRGLRHADHMVCVSRSTEQSLLRLGVCRPSQSTIIPNGLSDAFSPVDPAQATSTIAALDPALRRQPRGYIFQVGSNNWYKNRAFILDTYFELCRRVAVPPSLVLAGHGLDRIQAVRMQSAPPSARVITVGRVTDSQLVALYSNAACLFFPSLAEGFGWPILEAMACGCPVVTTNRAPMADVAGSAALLIDPTDAHAAAAALQRIVSMETGERDTMVAAGRKRAASFSITTMVHEVAELYGRLISATRTSKCHSLPTATAAPVA